jgi:hypothetical protein
MPGNVLPKPKMTHRRALPGLKTRPPLRDDAEYREALAELHGLGQAALGTPATRGLQALVECILDYEAKQACGPSAAAIPQAAATTHDGPDPSGRLA